jgi:2-polyprenyl-6-methoxyphenol hydroxylase-like FAD-dependent oxidoreductase
MEILKAELPSVYNSVVNSSSSSNTKSWEAFQFAGCVSGGGTRLGKVIHPVRYPIKVGQRGDATNVSDDDIASSLTASFLEKNRHWNPTATTISVHENEDDDDNGKIMTEQEEEDASACKPAHLAQNKFVSLLLQEVMSKQQQQQQQQQPTAQTSDESHLHYGEEVIDILPSSSSSSSFGTNHHDGSNNNNSNNNNNTNNDKSSPIVTITTSSGAQYQTKYLFACDGAHSYTRTKFCSPTIHMIGEPKVQELINVHFRTNTALSTFLMKQHQNENDDNQAMLHFIYNSQLVGCFVCHDGYEGEWVLQIPYFPPYQTLEVDFNYDKVRQMIWSGLLGIVMSDNNKKTDDDAGNNNTTYHLYDFEILSIRPWTMSCLVANQYYNQYNNIGLVGDAAHAFPPAGGFGMNTGLQDAHNLAWRVALSLKSSNSTSQLSSPSPFLVKYDNERRPIAQQNAALSLRNYKRTLQLAQACYLDAQHPALLLQALNLPPMNLLPMTVRQDMFRNLVKLAMMPLGSLLPSSSNDELSSSSSSTSLSMPYSFHANHIKSNVQKILRGGGSLPLVFPRYEIGFSYESSCKSNMGITTKDGKTEEEEDDTAGYIPRLCVGHRMPHVIVELTRITLSPNTHVDKCDELVLEGISAVTELATPSRIISLTDISSDLRRMNEMTTPLFTLLVIGSQCIIPHIDSAICRVMKGWNVPIILVNVLPPSCQGKLYNNNNNDATTKGRFLANLVTAIDTYETLFKLLRNEKKAMMSSRDDIISKGVMTDTDMEVNVLIMIRPDGHIANVTWMDEFPTTMNSFNTETIANDVHNAIERGLEHALCV